MIIIIICVYVFSTYTYLAEKLIKFPQGLGLLMYVNFRIFYFVNPCKFEV